jgi:GNAT superfamily N-acetyltransferase
MAHIHATSGTPGLLTDLGEPFLRDVYYRSIVRARLGRAQVLALDGAVVAFVSASPAAGSLFRSIFARHPIKLVSALVRGSVRNPRLILSFAEAALAVSHEPESRGVDAEIISLEVQPRMQHLGLGYVLLSSIIADLRRDDPATPIKVRILAGHREVERLYDALDFTTIRTFQMQGRPWKLLLLGPS